MISTINISLFILSPFLTEIKLNESKTRVCNAMVHNPIYDGDGPVYESVQTQLETELSISLFEDTTNQHYDNRHVTLNDTARYVNPPAQLQYLYTAGTNTASNSMNTPVNRSASVSLPETTPKVIAQKKNNQERNKLHLTLSLGENDSSNSHTGEEAPKLIPATHAVVPMDMDEPYTVMSPAGVII